MKAAFDRAYRDASFIKAKMNLSNFQGCRLENADLRGIRVMQYAMQTGDAIMDDDLRKALAKKWPKDK